MIPIKLALRNFMCYRENVPEINFEGIHTACISGNNGNGKSALIDAITWALWGETRANSADELIHAGQSEVEVDFDFAVGQQRYRIIRKHSKPKTQKSSGQTILEFQVASPDGYRVLTGNNPTETQHKITQILHMDYPTFINSAFLRQGRADEFTKKRPGERKQVLANILQLSVYDELEGRARDLSKEQEAAISQRQTSAQAIKEELSQKPSYQAEYEKAQNELAQVEELTKVQAARLKDLRQEKEGLENKKAQLSELSAHIRDSQRNFKLWSDQALQHQARVASYAVLIGKRPQIDAYYSQFLETRKLNQDFDQKLRQVTLFTQKRHRLEIAIMNAGQELNKVHAVTENRIRELETVSARLPALQEEQRQNEVQLQQLLEFESGLQEKRRRLGVSREKAGLLAAEQNRLTQELAQIEEKLQMLSHKSSGPYTCPLCETELGEQGEQRIEAKYRLEKVSKMEALRLTRNQLPTLENEVRTVENEILQSETKLNRNREILQSKRGNLSQAVADAQAAAARTDLDRTHLEEVEQRLASRDFAAAEQTTLEQIEKEISSIGYDLQKHEVLKKQLAELEQYEAPKRQLEEAERLIPQEVEAAAKASSLAEELKLKLASDSQRLQNLQIELNSFAAVAGNLSLAENEYQNLLGRQKGLQGVIGGAGSRLERLSQLEAKHKEQEEMIAAAAKQEKVFKDLALAFGKKGIQAMLIEMAIPEIEAEANKLLARMTDNRMHVKMETQRETKKGDVAETLDINISDELGTRNYEMFSGGEAFRIDFAIRIALSKLLARRAGAPLPTLIIDEGFGTQDASGIEKIKEAITSIQDDFEKILVITHIADFKDAFPMRIEVVKTPEGSTVYLN